MSSAQTNIISNSTIAITLPYSSIINCKSVYMSRFTLPLPLRVLRLTQIRKGGGGALSSCLTTVVVRAVFFRDGMIFGKLDSSLCTTRRCKGSHCACAMVLCSTETNLENRTHPSVCKTKTQSERKHTTYYVFESFVESPPQAIGQLSTP